MGYITMTYYVVLSLVLICAFIKLWPLARKFTYNLMSGFFVQPIITKKQRRDIRRARWAKEGFVYNSEDYKSKS